MVVQVRLKVWEAQSLVRLDWNGGGAPTVGRINGATLAQRTSLGQTGGSISFRLGDAARAASVGNRQKAFEVELGSGHVEDGALLMPSRVSCHFQLRPCTGASFQLVEDMGDAFRAEVLVSSWAAGAQVHLSFGGAAVELRDVWQATTLTPDGAPPTDLGFVLDTAPDGDGGFGFTAAGIVLGTPPTITCTLGDKTPPSRTLPGAAALAARQKAASSAPLKPPRARSSECGEFRLEWDAPDDASTVEASEDEWAVFYQRSGDEGSPVVGLGAGVHGRSYVAAGLPSQTALRFYVRRGSEARGWSALSPPSEPVTSELGAVPGKPTGVALAPLPALESAITCASLALTWRGSAGCAIQEHRVQARRVGDAKWVASTAGLAEGSVTRYAGFDSADDVGVLCRAEAARSSSAGSSIEVRVQAKSAAGWSGFSSSLTIRLGASEPPSHASAPAVSGAAPTCSGTVVRWAPPDTKGLPAAAHRLEWRPAAAPDSAPWQMMPVAADVASASLETLDGGVRYLVRVASESVLGWGAPSPPMALTTPRGTGPLTSPQPPTRIAPPPGRCDAIRLQLPPPRRGCEHDDALVLQIRSIPNLWQDLQTIDQSVPSSAISESSARSGHQLTGEKGGGAADGNRPAMADVGAAYGADGGAVSAGDEEAGTSRTAAAEGEVLITALEPYTAYQFRLVARRGELTSLPSEPTALLMPGPHADRIHKPPLVEATSSASYRLSWAANGAAVCRPQLVWDVLLVRPAQKPGDAMPTASLAGAAGGAPTDFAPATGAARMVGSGLVNTSSFEVLGVRCAPPGCGFRLHAVNVHGFDTPMWTATSALVPTNAPPTLPLGAARFEAQLALGAWKSLITVCRLPRPELCEATGDAAAFAQALGGQSACARNARCPPERLSVREIYGGARYVTFDLLPAAYGTTTPPPKAAVDALVAAARQLPIQELSSLPPPSISASRDGGAAAAAVTLYRVGGSGGGVGGLSTASIFLIVLAISAIGLAVALAVLLRMRRSDGRRTRRGAGGRAASRRDGSGSRNGGRHDKLGQMEDEYLDDMNDDDDEGFGFDRRAPAEVPQVERACQPAPPSRASAAAARDIVMDLDLDDMRPPPSVPAARTTIEVRVSLEGDEEVRLDVPLAGVADTETMLRAAFDACAEVVGMELEAHETKQIVLRYVLPSGKEKRLNTKVPWAELKQANAIVIKLQSTTGEAGRRQSRP